jgi:hypothetical protein
LLSSTPKSSLFRLNTGCPQRLAGRADLRPRQPLPGIPNANTIFPNGEIKLKQDISSVGSLTTGESVMWTFIEDLYRDYCLARLQEIRKYEMSRAEQTHA